MKRSIVAATVLGLVAPLGVLSAPPANATSTGIEISMDESELIVVGHPSPTGASDSQVTGDIAIRMEGSSFVVVVDEDSGGGAQLWSTDPSCNPATGSDVTRVTCAIPDPGDASVYIDLEGIDERGSGRLFAVVGDLFTTFLGSAYDDDFYAGDGGSYAEGGAGADSFFGGAGDDQVIGGPGPDTIDVSQDTGQDFVDCNDDSSRGTNQSVDPMNEVEWDPRYDEVMDCGFPGSPRGLTRPVVETPFIGSPVGSNLGTWEGKGLRYFRTWYICPQEKASVYQLCPSTPEKEIAGAEKATYTPTPADEGKGPRSPRRPPRRSSRRPHPSAARRPFSRARASARPSTGSVQPRRATTWRGAARESGPYRRRPRLASTVTPPVGASRYALTRSDVPGRA